MRRQLNASLARKFLAGASSLLPALAAAQNGCPQPSNPARQTEPPGRNMYVPYVSTQGLPHERELQNVEQVKILAEINKLTVELVKRRSDRNALQADTPLLTKRLKELAKKLRDAQ